MNFKEKELNKIQKIEYFDNILIDILLKQLNLDFLVINKILLKYGFFLKPYDFINIKLVEFLISKLYLNNIYKFYVNLNNLDLNNNNNFKKYPVVTIIGHVNQGKTSLLDSLCLSNFLKKEYGGITQKINCISSLNLKKKIVFLDTPGHEIFSSMRIISILNSDIILFIISINDILNKNNLELFNFLMIFNIPIILVINKIDLIKNKKDLNFIFSNVKYLNQFKKNKNNLIFLSIKNNYGLEELKKSINNIFFLTYKIKNLNYTIGTILNSYLDKNGFYVSLILLKFGQIKIGDIVLCGYNYSKIKFIQDEKNNQYIMYNKSLPILIGFFSSYLEIGLDFIILDKNVDYFNIIKDREENKRLLLLQKNENNQNKINFLIKTDCQNLYNIISKLIYDYFSINDINIVSSKIGILNLNELNLINNTQLNIIFFNIKINKQISLDLKKKKINYFIFNNIYNLISFLEKFSLEKSKAILKLTGTALVKNLFNLKKIIIAGCVLNFGNINITDKIEIFRNNKIIFKGEILSLKKFKNDLIKITILNEEFGIIIKDFIQFKINDIIKFYRG